VAWLLPELDVGAEPELNPAELELEPAELELEPVEPDSDEVDREPVEAELVDEPERAEVLADDEPEDSGVEEVAVCVDPGRASATRPTAATLATVAVVVAARTLARPRSLAATARRTRSRCALLMRAILLSRIRGLLDETSRLAMRQPGWSAEPAAARAAGAARRAPPW
jgi:hypothetical protein